MLLRYVSFRFVPSEFLAILFLIMNVLRRDLAESHWSRC